MSRTRPARSPNERDSSAGRPNSLTSSAPDTLNRSVIVAFIEAFSPYDSRVIACSRCPIRRAGSTKTGSRTSESTVICQDSENITPAVRTSAITLETTPDSVEVNACWAPITSLLSRLISAPVWVRVKNASGIRCTWSNTRVRRSKISPSPMRAEYHRWAREKPASKTARIATRTAIFTTVAGGAVRADHVDDPAGEHRGDHADHRAGGHGEQEDGQVAAGTAGRSRRSGARSPWAASARSPTRRAGTSASPSTARGRPASSSLAPPAGTKRAGCGALPPLRPRRNRRPVRVGRQANPDRLVASPARARRRRSWAARSAASCSSRSRPSAPSSSALVSVATSGGGDSSAATRSATAPSSEARGTTMVASPIASASTASTCRAVRQISSARG